MMETMVYCVLGSGRKLTRGCKGWQGKQYKRPRGLFLTSFRSRQERPTSSGGEGRFESEAERRHLRTLWGC